VSLLTDLRAPGTGRRQASREARLAAENARLRHLLTGAEQLIKGQQHENEALQERVAQQAADRVDVGVLRQQLEAAETANRRLTADYRALKAELENRTAIDVPPAVRDTSSPDDQQTEPIYVGAWRDWLAKQETAKATPAVLPLADALRGAS